MSRHISYAIFVACVVATMLTGAAGAVPPVNGGTVGGATVPVAAG